MNKHKRIMIVDDNSTIHEDSYKILGSKKRAILLDETELRLDGNSSLNQALHEIRQLVASLTKKWELKKNFQYQLDNLARLINERTIELEKSLALTQATLESTSEGILVVGCDKEIVIYNQVFFDMWNISSTSLQRENVDKIFEYLAVQVCHPEFFLQIMKKLEFYLVTYPKKEWKLKSGKVIEHNIHPYKVANEIVGSVLSFRDVTERKKHEENLFYQATHDSLTGLSNRSLLIDRIQKAIIHAQCNEHTVGVVFFDLDNFKKINDSLGHNVGDLVLQTASQRIKKCVNSTDTVTRLGGDEFVVVFSLQKNEEELKQSAERILNELSQPYYLSGCMLSVTASLGISIYRKNGFDAETLLKNADLAMYHAKERGKNTFQFYNDEFNFPRFNRREILG